MALFWPAAGVIAGLLIAAPAQCRWGVVAGSLIALAIGNASQGRDLATSLVFLAGNIAQATLMAGLLRPALPQRRLATVRVVGIFVGLSIAVPAAVGVFTSLGLRWSGHIAGDFASGWWLWASSQALGLLVATPAVLLLRPPLPLPGNHWIEHAALALYAGVTALIASTLREALDPRASLLLGLALLGPVAWWIGQRASLERAAVAVVLVGGWWIWDAAAAFPLHATPLEAQASLGLTAVLLLIWGVRQSAATAITTPAPPAASPLARVWSAQPQVSYLALFYSAYLLGAGLTQALTMLPGTWISIWPPNGFLLALFLLQRPASWPWWILIAVAGELTGNALWYHNPLPIALHFSAGNTLEAVVGAVLLRKFCSDAGQGGSLRDTVCLIAFGAGVATALGAAVNGVAGAIEGKQDFGDSFLRLWTGDATGILIGTPIALALMHAWRDPPKFSRMRALEALAVSAAYIGAVVLALGGYAPIAYVALPPLVWAALRFGRLGAATGSVFLALATAAFTVAGVSPFAATETLSLNEELQLFLAVASMSALLVAGLARDHESALGRLRLANETLEQRVAERTASLARSEQRFRGVFDRAGIGIAIGTMDGRIEACNPAFAAMLGRDAQALTGVDFLDIVHPEDREHSAREFEKLRLQQIPALEVENRFVRADGVAVLAHRHVTLLRDEHGNPGGAIVLATDLSERHRARERQKVLMLELAHRGKNLLGVIQSIANRTFAGDAPMKEAKLAFVGRLQALAHTYTSLTQERFEGAALRTILAEELKPFGQRVTVEGPPVKLSPKVAQTFSLIVHELATNAGKYGALSVEGGRLQVFWSAIGDGPDRRFAFEWRETGGPPVKPPRKKGFGASIISAVAADAFDCEPRMHYAPEGFSYRIEAPLARVGEILDEPDVRSRIKSDTLRDFLDAWVAVRPSVNTTPQLDDFDRTRFAATGGLTLARVHRDQVEFVEVGRALRDRFGHEAFEQAEMDGSQALRNAYLRCAQAAEPVYEDMRFRFDDSETITFERLLLPLSGGGGRIAYVTGLVVFSEAGREERGRGL